MKNGKSPTAKSGNPRHVNKVFEAFRFAPELSKWLATTAEKTGKTKTRIVEEALRSKMALKEAA